MSKQLIILLYKFYFYPMKIKHIFFDLDHTLWDFETNSVATFSKIFKDNKLEVNVEKFITYYKIINLRYWKLYRNEKMTREALRYGRLKDTFDFLKYNVSDKTIDLLADEYLNVLPTFNTLFEGTHELLTYLKAKYQLHIITNGFSEVQNDKLKNAGIEKYFDKIITSENTGVKKPNPKIFQYAIDISRANVKESIMIGDNWEADIMGAKNYGMKVIFCNFENQIVDESIPSVKELLDIKKYL